MVLKSNYNDGYSSEVYAKCNNPKWMKDINGNMTINEINIPGTHDTMAHKTNYVHSVRTQSMPLDVQLNSGIRYLDIRCFYEPNYEGFTIYHGIVYLDYSLDDVLTTVSKFLEANPSETILMRIKQENSSVSSEVFANRLYNKYVNKYSKYFWHRYSWNPTLDDVRGKIVILKDFTYSGIGIDYRNFDIQDRYSLDNNWALYSKWENIKEHLRITNLGNRSNGYINHLSASGIWSFPYFVASGHSNMDTYAPRLVTGLIGPAFNSYYPDFPRSDTNEIWFKGTNILTTSYLSKLNNRKVGIVVADFLGPGLINRVIDLNDDIVNLSNDIFKIVSKLNNNKVLNAYNYNNNVGIHDSNSNNNQEWIFEYDKSKNAYKIKSEIGSNLVLACNNKTVSRNVFVTTFTGDDEHYWKLKNMGSGYYVIENYNQNNRNMVLDLYGSNTENGSNIQIHERHNNDNQKFKIVKAQISGEWMIASKSNTNKVLDVNASNNVTVWDKNGGNNQRWIFEYIKSEKAYKIKSKMNPNMVLAWNAYNGGRNVFLTKFHYNNNEHFWILEDVGNGDYIFRNHKDQNKILNLDADSSNISVSESRNNDNQKFRLI